MKNYQEFLTRKRKEYGEKFDPSDLAPEFVRYYETGERIEVAMSYGENKRGRVGITTGWKPVFILLPRVDSTGSSEVLGHADKFKRVISR